MTTTPCDYWTPGHIRAFRISRQLHQPEFGALIGLSGRRVKDLEAGRSRPTKQTTIILNLVSTQEYHGFTDVELITIHKALCDAKYFLNVNGPIVRRLRNALRILEERVAHDT